MLLIVASVIWTMMYKLNETIEQEQGSISVTEKFLLI